MDFRGLPSTIAKKEKVHLSNHATYVPTDSMDTGSNGVNLIHYGLQLLLAKRYGGKWQNLYIWHENLFAIEEAGGKYGPVNVLILVIIANWT